MTLVLLLPLKQTVPYLVYLDKATGVTQVADVMTPSRITQDQANARHWVYRYVLARERYVYKLLQADLEFAVALSTPEQSKELIRPYEEGPQKKDVLLKDRVEERVRVLSVSITSEGKATARFIKETFSAGITTPEKSESFIADIAFEWTGANGWTEANLLVNPLGFKVSAYRTTLESLK